MCAKRGDLDTLRALLEAKAELGAATLEGDTALHFAAGRGLLGARARAWARGRVLGTCWGVWSSEESFLQTFFFCLLLVLKGIYRYWKYVIVSGGLKQMEVPGRVLGTEGGFWDKEEKNTKRWVSCKKVEKAPTPRKGRPEKKRPTQPPLLVLLEASSQF